MIQVTTFAISLELCGVHISMAYCFKGISSDFVTRSDMFRSVTILAFPIFYKKNHIPLFFPSNFKTIFTNGGHFKTKIIIKF